MLERIKSLPNWVLTGTRPAFYDSESATAVEQTAKLYGKMNELVDDYNKFVDELNNTINEFINNTNTDQEEFKNHITKIMHDYISMLDEKIKNQDGVIADAVDYMKTNLSISIKRLNDNNELDHMIVEAISNVEQELNDKHSSFETKITQRQTNFESSVNNEVRTANARIDTLTHLEDGSTTGDAELQDIRVDYNGETHNSAGESVRTQTGGLNNRLRVIEDKNILEYETSENIFNKTTIETEKGLSSNTGATFDLPGYFTSDFMRVDSDTIYHLINRSDANTIEYDEHKNFVKATYNVETITTQPNTKYVRVQSKNSVLDKLMFCKNVKPTDYIPYGEYLKLSSIEDRSINNSKIADKTITPEKVNFVKIGKNRFNKNTINENSYLSSTTGATFDVDGYFSSEFIDIHDFSNIAASNVESLCLYDSDKNFLRNISTAVSPFHIIVENPDCYYVKVAAKNSFLENTQVEDNIEVTGYEEYCFEFDTNKINIQSTESTKRIFTLKEAWNRWAVGEKFPIGFLGDSTTDGANTTGWSYETGHENKDNLAGGWGKHDYINVNAYPYKLEQLIKGELNNNQMRVYNIGYSGTFFKWARPKYDEIFGGVYSDVKMVGITYGINDRCNYATLKDFYNGFRYELVYLINYLYKKGIQPFLVTTQPTIEPDIHSNFVDSMPLRTTEIINSVANKIKFEVAEEYNLEIIDINKFGEYIMNYSEYTISQICPDHLHFSNLGHTLEAEFLFSEICPRAIDVNKNDLLSFVNQCYQSDIPDDKITYLTTPIDKLKVEAKYTKDDTSNILIQDFWINNISKEKLSLKSYCSSKEKQYVIVDGVTYNITSLQQVICELEIGVHHIEVYSGETTNVNWIGFKLI